MKWHHDECNGISNHWRLDCFLNPFFRRKSKKTSKLHVTGLCKGNSLETSEFRTQRVSNAENVSIWWCHHDNSLFAGNISQSATHHWGPAPNCWNRLCLKRCDDFAFNHEIPFALHQQSHEISQKLAYCILRYHVHVIKSQMVGWQWKCSYMIQHYTQLNIHKGIAHFIYWIHING